ncbi:WXG100 family type VII secretion target [Buchananella felis]|uniref:WXG100 family type VII secretion target n=1 Tax=Buchananella felis TaxID=3231492 RepID=UPI003527AB6F
MAMIGMDVEQVRALAREFEDKAGTLEQAKSSIGTKLRSTEWKGSDATQFTSDWDNTLSKQLQNVIDALKQAAQKAKQNAQRQEDTSRDL